MWWLLLIPFVILVVGFLLFRPSPLTVTRTRIIKKSQPEVFAKIRDFRSWKEWSPWILADPGCKLKYTGDTSAVGGKYSWAGDIIGAGEMEHTKIGEPSRLEMDLHFTKPFKSTSKVNFECNEVRDGTAVIWSMEGKMPKIMIPMFRTMISMDYKRGLDRLGDLMETGTINSRIDVVGIVDRPSIYWIGIEASCPMDDIGPSMTKTFETLKQRLTEAKITPKLCLSIYSKWDFKTSTCTYIAAFEVDQGLCCDGTTTGLIPEHQAYGVSHYGPYDHLGDAWFTAHTHTRAKKHKCPKGGPFPYEIYVTEPGTVPTTDIRTDIFIPIR
jgi:predicted transcriptional regulator YdeE